MRRRLLITLVVAACLIRCGEASRRVGSEIGRDSGVRSKRAGSIRTQTQVTMTVKEGGFVAPGLLIEVRRSVSGVVDGDSWSTVTDAGGLGLVTVEVDPDGPFRHTGVSGYYRVKAIDASTGVVRGEWGSIPLNGPTESLYLPVGGHPLENAPVLFGDAGLEAAVRVLAGVENGDLTTSDVGHLVSLDLTRSDISSLAGLEDLVFLEAVTLTENQVDDLGPLSAVRNLRHLDADHNQVTENLAQLKELAVEGCGVVDVSAFRGLTNLTWLSLNGNDIEELSPLAGMVLLEHLDLRASGDPGAQRKRGGGRWRTRHDVAAEDSRFAGE